jgi:hypothetical protein
MQTIPEIINIAKISGYLADNAVDANKVFVFGSLDKDLPKKIYMETAALEWAYNNNAASTTSLRNVANWVYDLCGKYATIAKGIVAGGSGNIIYNPSTGQLLNGLITVQNQFIIGTPQSPIAIGGTTFTITDSRIVAGSFEIHADGLELPETLTTQTSYSVQYTSSTIVVTFNYPVPEGQVYRYMYQKGLSTATGKAIQPTIYFTCLGGETQISFAELSSVLIGDLVLVSRATGVKRPVSTVTADMNQLQYVGGVFYAPTGDVFYQGEVISVTYMA